MVTAEALLTKIQAQLGDMVKTNIEYAQLILDVESKNLIACSKILRDHADLQFTQLIDLCGVDYLEYGISSWATDSASDQGFSRGVAVDQFSTEQESRFPARFAVVYQLLSVTHNQRVRLRCFLTNKPLIIPSVMQLWPAADWYEREAFDLFGIEFDGHPDMRRILTDYGFVGHPFRKDFPLIGEVEMRYDATQAKVVYEPVSIEPRTLVPKVITHAGPRWQK